jgi:G:T-mismatch repair DNA endonuclease (very short patch repair protein)
MFSKEITQFLDDNKIVYKTERPIKGDNFKYFVDILIDNIVIECFGDYWHCTPDKYGPDYYHSQIKLSAKEIWDRDALRIDRIRNKGFRTMIIWEGKFNQNKNKVQKEILNEICKN